MSFTFCLPDNLSERHPKQKIFKKLRPQQDWHSFQRHHVGFLNLYRSYQKKCRAIQRQTMERIQQQTTINSNNKLKSITTINDNSKKKITNLSCITMESHQIGKVWQGNIEPTPNNEA